jgi:hypothetical protein
MKAKGPSVSWLPWRVAAYWLALIAFVVLLYWRYKHERPRILELCLCLAWLWFIIRQKPMMATFKALQAPYRVFLVVLVMVMFGAQLIDQSHITFPFVSWALYERPAHGDPQYYDYTAVLQSGQERRLEVFRTSRSLSYRLMFPLNNMAHTIHQAPQGQQRQELLANYEAVLRTVAHMYNQRNADDPIRTVHVWHCTVPLRAYRGPASIQRRLFWQLQVQ